MLEIHKCNDLSMIFYTFHVVPFVREEYEEEMKI